MTEATAGKLRSLNLQPRKENLVGRLDAAIVDFISGYQQLRDNPGAYLVAAKGQNADSTAIAQTVKDFHPLDENQMHDLVDMSQTLGIPLSPLGLITFTSGKLIEIKWTLAGGGVMGGEGGFLMEPRKFSAGPSSRAGLWAAHTRSVSTFTDLELEKLDIHSSDVVPAIYLPPTHEDHLELSPAYTHEAFHGTHIFLSPDIFAVNPKAPFDSKLLREGLALRTEFLKGIIDANGFRKRLISDYFYGNFSRRQNRKIHAFVDLVTASKDPIYQKEITWRGICANDLKDFFDPSEDSKNLASWLADYSQQVVLPKYRKALSCAVQRTSLEP